MNIDVYCDEAYPDLFSSHHPHARYLVIGSVWLNRDDRDRLQFVTACVADNAATLAKIKNRSFCRAGSTAVFVGSAATGRERFSYRQYRAGSQAQTNY
jgi:hypothetical protein